MTYGLNVGMKVKNECGSEELKLCLKFADYFTEHITGSMNEAINAMNRMKLESQLLQATGMLSFINTLHCNLNY